MRRDEKQQKYWESIKDSREFRRMETAYHDFGYSWGGLKKRDIMRIYSLEYKLEKLNDKRKLTDELTDTEYLYYHKLKNEAIELCNKLIPTMVDIMENWIKMHHRVHDAHPLNSNMPIKTDLSKQVVFTWGYLRNALSPSVSLNQKITAIDMGVHLLHGQGQSMIMLGEHEFVGDTTTLNKAKEESAKGTHEEWRFLDDLSADKFIPEWEREIQLRANYKTNWYKIAQTQEYQEFIEDSSRFDDAIHNPVKRFKKLIRDEFGLSGVTINFTKDNLTTAVVEFINGNYIALKKASRIDPNLVWQYIVPNTDEGKLQKMLSAGNIGTVNLSIDDQQFLAGLDQSNVFNRNFYIWAVGQYNSSIGTPIEDIYMWALPKNEDLTQHTLDEIINWMRMDNSTDDESKPPLPCGPIADQPIIANGQTFYVINLNSAEALREEGSSMNNCVAGYYERGRSQISFGGTPRFSIYSLRDSNNNPHVTLTLSGNNYITEMKEANNVELQEGSQYFPFIQQWIAANNLQDFSGAIELLQQDNLNSPKAIEEVKDVAFLSGDSIVFSELARKGILKLLQNVHGQNQMRVLPVARALKTLGVDIPLVEQFLSYQNDLGVSELRANAENENWYKWAQVDDDDDEYVDQTEELEYKTEDELQELPSDFQVRIIDDVYTVQQLTDNDFKIKYNAQKELIFIFAKIKYEWAEHELPYRSIIVDLNGNIVSAGFPKFFNYGESQYSEPIDQIFTHAIADQDPDVIFTHKYDGTLIIRSVVNGEVMMRTRGMFLGGEYGEVAKKIAAQKYPQLLDPDYLTDISLLFEYIGPENRIVIKYEDADLILIGAISHNTLHPLSWNEIVSIDRALKLAKTYTLTGKSLDEVNDFLIQYPELIEGLVVRYNGQLVKIKTEDYLRLHRIKSNVTYKNVAEIIRNNNISNWEQMEKFLMDIGYDTEWFDEIKVYFDEYFTKQEYRRQIMELSPIVVERLRDDSIADDRARKADFAQKIKDISPTAKPFLFAAYDGKLEQVMNKPKDYEMEYLEEVVATLVNMIS